MKNAGIFTVQIDNIWGTGHAIITRVIPIMKTSCKVFWKKLSSKSNKGLLFPKLWIVVVYLHGGVEVLGFGYSYLLMCSSF